MTFDKLLGQFYDRAEDVDGVKTIQITKKQALYLARLLTSETQAKATIHEMKANIHGKFTKFTPNYFGWKLQFLEYSE